MILYSNSADYQVFDLFSHFIVMVDVFRNVILILLYTIHTCILTFDCQITTPLPTLQTLE